MADFFFHVSEGATHYFSCNFINCCIENNKNDLPTKKKKNVQVTLVSEEKNMN